MAEVVSELDKLREAAKLIEEMSQGRLQVCPSVVGQVYIRPENEAYLGLDMRINSIPGQLRYRVTFSSQMRRMGADMTSEGLRTLLSEDLCAANCARIKELYAHDRGSDSISGRTVGGTGSKVIPNFESDDIKGG